MVSSKKKQCANVGFDIRYALGRIQPNLEIYGILFVKK